MTPAPSGTIVRPGGRALAYDDIGAPGGSPVVYLHGNPDCRLTRPPVAAVDGVRIIAVDRPGYGASGTDPAATYASMADDVAALLDALGIGRAAVLAWSAGGPVALAAAERHPDIVAALGLAAVMPPIEADADPAVRAALNPAFAARTELVADAGVEALVDMVTPLLAPLAPDLDLAREFVVEGQDEAYLADLAAVPGLHDQLALALTVAVASSLDGPAMDARCAFEPAHLDLGAVRAPTTLWFGTADAMCGPAAGRWLADRIPGAHLEVLEGASHLLTLVHWQRLVRELVNLTKGALDVAQP